MITLQHLRDEAEHQLAGVAEGAPLDEATAELVAFAVRIAVTTLDPAGAAVHAERARRAGATSEQLQEVVLLVSGLGMHTLFEGLRLATQAGAGARRAPPSEAVQQQLWNTWVGDDRYWKAFDSEWPGFLGQLLQASPPAFDAFFRYCALPWKTAHLPAVTKELVAMATDATPTHRYLPGFRLHLRNATKLGAGASMVRRAIDIAAEAPSHEGVG